MPSARPVNAPRRGAPARGRANPTARRILDAAREVLMLHGHAQFSMRNVSSHAGLHLANLQYYFPTRDDLVQALMQDTGERYRARYERVLARAPNDRVARFTAVLDFNLRDTLRPDTRRFFLQLWALLVALDEGGVRRLSDLYEIDLGLLIERIVELDPAAAPAQVRRRATLLAALTEGLVVVSGAHSRAKSEMARLIEQARTLGLSIASGTADGAAG